MTADKAGGRFGFAGLGQMGGPMATNIAAAGFDLSVFDKAGTAGDERCGHEVGTGSFMGMAEVVLANINKASFRAFFWLWLL